MPKAEALPRKQKLSIQTGLDTGGTAVSVLPSEKVMQENDIEELLNNEGNPDIVLEEANGYSRKSLG